MKLITIKRNMINWLKNIAYDSKATNSGYTASGHCPNFATRCCLTCDRCWKNYHGTK
ncbi:hypothetical protein ACFHWD_18610 [Clostridium sp. MT-14]|uniref:hypothetical protein n=1 Tax=unclassified Clostridium TaxID=2614128 RepID=UPI00156C67F3|nr:hypothetical protein [Clostridium sp. HV4-5-A1G]CAB1249632.1 hypothetical protein CLOSBL3_11918 [Clostridiaceae bacterium BL-3]